MDLRWFNGEKVTIIRSTQVYAQGKPVFNENTGEPIYVTEELEVEALCYYRKSRSSLTPYEEKFESEMTLIFPNGTPVYKTDVMKVRDTLWEPDTIEVPITQYTRFNRFLKPPTIMGMKQQAGKVNG